MPEPLPDAPAEPANAELLPEPAVANEACAGVAEQADAVPLPSPAGKPVAPASTRTPGKAIESERLELEGADGQLVQIGVRTEQGKALLR